MPAVLCRCTCGCPEHVAYIGLGQMEPEDKGDSSLICETCSSGVHYHHIIEAMTEQAMREDELRSEEKKHQDEVSKNHGDDPRTILNRRLASGEITVDEYDRIKERLD